MADGSSRMAGIEGLPIPADGTVLRPIVRSIGEAIHERSNARTIFNQEVLCIHLEETHSPAVGKCAVGRSEKALQGGTVVERVEALSQNEVQHKGSPASHF